VLVAGLSAARRGGLVGALVVDGGRCLDRDAQDELASIGL